jgi:hypothetical protein
VSVVTKQKAKTIYAPTSQTISASGNSGDFGAANAAGGYDFSDVDELSIGVNATGQSGTTPTLDVYLDLKGPDGIYYQVAHLTQLTSSTLQAIASIGDGLANNYSLTSTGRLRWVIGGSGSPQFTGLTMWVTGR